MTKSRTIRAVFTLVIAVLIGSLFLCQEGISAAPDNYFSHALLKDRYVTRWNDSTQTIKVHLEPGVKLKGWHPKKMDLVRDAFKEWQTAMGGRFRFVYTDSPYETDIHVMFIQRSKGEKIGLTSSQWDGSMTLTDTDIELALINPMGKWMTDTELRTTALHEIGHALGIKGHSPSAKDVMYPMIHSGINHLSARDIATMKTVYAHKPDITNPVGISFGKYKRFLAFARRGYNDFQKGQYKKAYEGFSQAHHYYQKHPRIPYYTGVAAYHAGLLSRAAPYFEQALRMKGPDQHLAEFYLATTLAQLGTAEVHSGKTGAGNKKLSRARDLYKKVVLYKDLPPSMKQYANSDLTQLNQEANLK